MENRKIIDENLTTSELPTEESPKKQTLRDDDDVGNDDVGNDGEVEEPSAIPTTLESLVESLNLPVDDDDQGAEDVVGDGGGGGVGDGGGGDGGNFPSSTMNAHVGFTFMESAMVPTTTDNHDSLQTASVANDVVGVGEDAGGVFSEGVLEPAPTPPVVREAAIEEQERSQAKQASASSLSTTTTTTTSNSAIPLTTTTTRTTTMTMTTTSSKLDQASAQAVYQCNHCGKQFKDKYYLRKHENVHTRVKKYVCDVCGKSFNQNSGLYTHKKLHLDQTPFKCAVAECGKAFTTKNSLISHSSEHTGIRPFACESEWLLGISTWYNYNWLQIIHCIPS